jgi:hypothetical protein
MRWFFNLPFPSWLIAFELASQQQIRRRVLLAFAAVYLPSFSVLH